MWIITRDEEGPIFTNLNMRLDVRFISVRSLDKTFVQAHPQLQGHRFGDADEMLMVLIGPGPTDFEIVCSVPAGENQQRIIAHLQSAVRRALEDGLSLLDIDDVLAEATRHAQSDD